MGRIRVGAFRRFGDALGQFPEEEKEWFRFQGEKNKEEVKEWLESIGGIVTWLGKKHVPGVIIGGVTASNDLEVRN